MEKEESKRKVMVLGLARSGVAAARLLASRGAGVLAVDENPSLDAGGALNGVRTVLGKADTSMLEGIEQLVVSPGVPAEHELVSEARRKGIEVISELELASRYAKAGIIAVTGTNGKSTTVSMIGAILDRAGVGNVVAGNVGVPFSSVVDRLGPGEYFVIEVSSFQLETVRDFHPVSAGILNLTPDHLDRYSGAEEYYAVKKRISENCTEGDVFFFNADDRRCAEAADGFPGTVVPFSTNTRPEGGSYLDGDVLVRTVKDGRCEKVMEAAELGVLGLHNVENALAAISSLKDLDISAQACREALSRFRGLRHRMELVAEIEGVGYYNDSKATNVEAAVKSLAGLTSPVVLIAGGYDKGTGYSGLKEIAGKLRAAVTIGVAAQQIEDVLEDSVETKRAADMREAVRTAASLASPGDLVVLSPACASFDMFRDFEHRGDVFTECVRELVKG